MSKKDETITPGTFKEAPKWMQKIYAPTPAEREQWQKEGFPPDNEIVGSILEGSKRIWGVPSKSEIYAFDALRAANAEFPDTRTHKSLHLRTAELSILPTSFEIEHPPISASGGNIVEHNYLAHIQVVTVRVDLENIKVIHGSPDGSEAVVFEGADYGTVGNPTVKIYRVTVHDTRDPIDKGGSVAATYEVVAETAYPRYRLPF